MRTELQRSRRGAWEPHQTFGAEFDGPVDAPVEAPTPPQPKRRFFGEAVGLDAVVLSVFGLGLAFLFGANKRVFADGDTSWHLAAGQWMLQHGRVPFSDPFSYTAFGKPWIAHEWLSEIVMALAFRAGGYTGLSLLVALAVGLTLLIIGLRLRRWLPPVETCLALMVVTLGLLPLMLARPLVLTWPLLAWWTEELLRARERDSLPPLYLIPLMTLWINLHASFAVGLGLLAFFALDALAASKDRGWTLTLWGTFGGAAGLATLLNPNGLTNALLPLGVFTSPSVGLISEFRPTAPTLFPGFELALVLFIAVALARGARIPLVRLVLVMTLLHLALAHIRHQAIWLIVTALVALPALSTAWIAGRAPKPAFLAELRHWQGGPGRAIAASLAILALLCGARLMVPIAPAESTVNATRAFDNIPASLMRERVFNEYSMGGPLILRGVRVFMDGRTDLYGDPHFFAYREASKGNRAAFERALHQWKFCWTIFPASERNFLDMLDGSPAWERIYADKYAVIHVRRPCGQFVAAPGTGA